MVLIHTFRALWIYQINNNNINTFGVIQNSIKLYRMFIRKDSFRVIDLDRF